MRFTWDPRKATANVRKHRVSFEEAVTVFADPLALFVADAFDEERGLLIGESAARRVLVAAFIDTDVAEIRHPQCSARDRARKEEV